MYECIGPIKAFALQSRRSRHVSNPGLIPVVIARYPHALYDKVLVQHCLAPTSMVDVALWKPLVELDAISGALGFEVAIVQFWATRPDIGEASPDQRRF